MDLLTRPKRPARRANPLPDQVAITLRDRIRVGQYQTGCKLPSERTLEADLSVDRRTVRAAIEQLATEGMLDIRPKCRPVVKAAVSKRLDPKLIALVMLSTTSSRPGSTRQRVFWGVNEGLAGSGFHAVPLDLIPRISQANVRKADYEAEHLNYVLEHGFAGVVFHPQSYNSNSELLRKVAQQMPLVLLEHQIPGVQADFVGLENRKLSEEATRDLIHQGHKRVAFLTTGEFSNTAHERLEGYLQALSYAFPCNPYELVLNPPLVNSMSWPLFEAISKLPADKRPTAIVCSTNQEAERATIHLRALNLRVPEDVSLISLENNGLTLCGNSTGSTAVAQHFEIGKAAAKLIIRRCNEPSVDLAHIELPGKSIVYNAGSLAY
jgi:DNA-binding LacI/PurR family transcriptional regulator/DNA-binding transcriptional regulator YhcF (GntR family)